MTQQSKMLLEQTSSYVGRVLCEMGLQHTGNRNQHIWRQKCNTFFERQG
jgi:hypothetical protein